MDASQLLHWHYMIYLLPLGVAAFFLLLSSLRLGHHGSHGADAGHGVHGHVGHAHIHLGGHHGHVSAGVAETGHHGVHAPHTASGHVAGHGQAVGHGDAGGHAHTGTDSTDAPSADRSREAVAAPPSLLLSLLGIDRAPLPIVIEMFLIVFGLTGLWANQAFVRQPDPSIARMLPSLLVAFLGGLVGGRIAAEVVGRLLPREETTVVSREGLYGLTGKVVFAVSDTGGRIHVYDEFGTLHDETCRVAPGNPGIEKGRTALIVDRDRDGNLIVEEIDTK